MGFLAPKAPPAPASPPPAPLPPRNITIGGTPIDRAKQRRRSSLATAAGQNRTLLGDALGGSTSNQPLGV